MDFPLLTAIAQSDLPPLQRLVLVMLLNHADKHGRAWPSHATLARETGMAVRSIGSHMRHLEKAGWLVRVGSREREGQMGATGVFHVVSPSSAGRSVPQTTSMDKASAATPPRHALPGGQQEMPECARQDLPTGPASGAEGSARDAGEVGISCRQTTQEPLNNHPENHPILQEEGGPPPGVEEVAAPAKAAVGAPNPQLSLTKPQLSLPHAQPSLTSPQLSLPRRADWREWHRAQAEAANAVLPAPHVPREFAEAWQRYRDYRTERATAARVSSEAVAWTAAAAAAALRSCERHAQAHGWMAVVAQIDTAIAGNWRGLNFPAHCSSAASGMAAAAGTRAAAGGAAAPFRSFGTAGRPRTYQAETATEGYTDAEVLSFMPPSLNRSVIKK